eukprot:jgi/Orpsp1_1/1176249/evm.model.c7180000056943.1
MLVSSLILFFIAINAVLGAPTKTISPSSCPIDYDEKEDKECVGKHGVYIKFYNTNTGCAYYSCSLKVNSAKTVVVQSSKTKMKFSTKTVPSSSKKSTIKSSSTTISVSSINTKSVKSTTTKSVTSTKINNTTTTFKKATTTSTKVNNTTTTSKKTTTTTTTTKITTTVTSKSEENNCSSKYAQCGGSGYTGPSCCKSGSTCKKFNEWYSQC